MLPSQVTIIWKEKKIPMEMLNLKNVNNYLNSNIYSYLEPSGSQSYFIFLNIVNFFNASVN